MTAQLLEHGCSKCADNDNSFKYVHNSINGKPQLSSSVLRKLSCTASGIMRLLRQISLDGNILRHSAFSKSDQAERLGPNFARHLTDTINLVTGLLADLKRGDTTVESTSNERNGKKVKSNSGENSILKVLEELNSLIVYLIKLCLDKESLQKLNEKPKSKLRRQYSAFVESGQFRRIRRSLSRQDSESSLNANSPGSSPPKNENLSSSLLLGESQFVTNLGCTLEEAIRKLIDSQILSHLLEAIPNIGFEEKKTVRIILTNSMILEVNKCHLVVDHISDTSSGILRCLVQSYEIGRSDVTLNCGSILRFASQYPPIVSSILKSELLYDFFAYMQRCPTSYPFDVAMDVFFTFKTIITRHPATTIAALSVNSGPFFDAFIQLLRHADVTENYVTKRQTLEIFADVFAGGAECNCLREQLISQDCYLFPVITYLWNRNVQIRLRCLVLLNQLFRISNDDESAPIDNGDQEKPNENAESNDNEEVELGVKNNWKIQLLLDKIALIKQESDHKWKMAELSTQMGWIREMFVELRDECCKSSSTSQLLFVDQVITFCITGNSN